MVNRKFVFLLGIFIALIVSLNFVSAATSLLSPAINGNYTTSINFTCTTDVTNAMNATLMYNPTGGQANTSLVTVANTSVGQTLFTNASVPVSTLADIRTYNFSCQVINQTTNWVENSSGLTEITIDNTAPVIVVKSYINATFKKSTDLLALNISVIDATSLLSKSLCIINVNGTNQTVAILNGWCNTTSVSLTNLEDGNRTINVFVNDTVNNVALNNSYVVGVDTTAPVPTASCSLSGIVAINVLIDCVCSGTDATSGVNASATTASETITFGTLGSYVWNCSVTDYAGNSEISSVTFTVRDVGSGGGGGSSSTNVWTGGIIEVADSQFENGFSKEIFVKSRMHVKIGNESHYVGLVGLDANSATINISSDYSQQLIFNVGDEKMFDVNYDGYYDIRVVLNRVIGNKANITVQKVYEKVLAVPSPVIPSPGVSPSTPDENSDGLVNESTGKGSVGWVIAIVVLILLLIIGGVLVAKRKNSNKK